jgi:hypothetical protein
MKRYGYLYGAITDYNNIVLAHKKAKQGKSYYEEVQLIDQEPTKYFEAIQAMLIDKTFRTSPYRTKMIHEPKERIIYKLPYYPDRIVHHAIMNVLQPIWDTIFIEDLYSAIPGRGLHEGTIKLRKWLHNKEATRYCLKFDIAQYYPSVSHDILFGLIARKIKCRDTLWLLEGIVRSPGGTANIPIGNYLSQYFGNIYLNYFDHWLKEEHRVRYYMRYGDDGIILNGSKQRLNDLLYDINIYLEDELALTLNNKTQLFKVDGRGIDFLGYRCFRDYTLLRKSSANRFKKKVGFIERNSKVLPPQHIISSVMSYCGWIDWCNGHNLLERYVLGNTRLLAIMDEAASTLGIDNPLRAKYGLPHDNPSMVI